MNYLNYYNNIVEVEKMTCGRQEESGYGFLRQRPGMSVVGGRQRQIPEGFAGNVLKLPVGLGGLLKAVSTMSLP